MTVFLQLLGTFTLVCFSGIVAAFLYGLGRDAWKEHQLRRREIRDLLRSIETVKR